ncbi:chemotaxis protein CheB [Arenibaculum pallidiluteum]|uniref:chemotaxis protein CheB n=1 Tax=Arenibaculum pallidiluteum TaxID=2812559 RepID=UPI001A9651F3|nr:chemotaxis protein CheB [Arenibaculum pallidiluteum]
MAPKDIIVIGGSAGGLEALRTLVAGLPRWFPAAVFVVLHIGARRSNAPEILGRAGLLPSLFAADGMPIAAGAIYVAPPDHHMLLAPGRMRLSRGPRENYTRPAIDPLFRSAAEAYGPRVVGVILSGSLSDGTAGLSEIKGHGGTTVVQDPAGARAPGMPSSALANVTVDHCVPIGDLAELLVGLTAKNRPPAAARGPSTEERDMSGEFELNPPVALTCPECGGAMKERTVDSLPYYTCHIGHRLAAPDMEAAQFRQMEQALEVALRSLNERMSLCERMGEAARRKGHGMVAEHWEDSARETRERAEVLRRFLQQDWTRPEPDGEEHRAAGTGAG